MRIETRQVPPIIVPNVCRLSGIPHKRHTKAVNTLLGWYRDRVDVHARLPVLSTYQHADTSSTQQYIHADMTIKERALALLTPPAVKPGRYIPSDDVLRFLESLG